MLRRRLSTFVFTGAFTGLMALAGAGALAQAEAERQVDAALERLRASFGPDARLTVGLRQVDPVTGRTRLGNLVIAAPQERLAMAELLLQDVTESRLGRAEAREVVLQTDIGGDNDRMELSRLVLGGIPLPAPGTALSLANFELGELEADGLRGTAKSGTLVVGRATAQGYAPGVLGMAQVEGVDFQGEGKQAPSFRLGRAAVQSLVMPVMDGSTPPDPRQFTVQSLTLEGAALRAPDEQVDLEVGRFALRDWIPGRLAELALEGTRIGAPFGPLGQGDMRIGRVAASGIDGATTLAAILDGVQPPDPVPGTPQRFTVEGVTAATGGQPMFQLGRIALDGAVEAGGRLVGGMAFEGLRVTLPPGTAAWLEQIGYRAIAGGIELRAAMQREGGAMEIEPFRIAWDEAGTLTLRSELDGMPIPQAGQVKDDEAYMQQLMQARLRSLTLSYRDQGLLGRAIAWQARQQRMPEERLREQMAQMALAMPVPGGGRPTPPAGPARKGAPAAAAPQADPLLELRQALASFIRQPRELEISLRPPQPVGFGEMAALGALGPVESARRLGLSAVAR